ncbi:MAG TPA: methylated-DNA--[protein]-cysteine S-methyltransferase [Thermoanaerobaculia bacterium]|nr:methylated-DNA--[protein]-cysteine S-methyltransferase [Thermoanaerobaculia bacterium]
MLLPSPVGALGVELSGAVVTRLWIEPVEPVLSTLIPLRKLDGSDLLDEIFGRLSEYLAGARRKLDIEYDLAASGVNGFGRRVLKEVCRIPYGKTRNYQELAEASGRPEAADQVLAVLLENPLPLLIPCHRVLGPDSVGSYVGGTDRKRWLLDLESHPQELG